MTIVVFGSINMDLVVRAARLPAPGETLAGSDFATLPGGKGANQAVACARLGAVTRMVGAVGDDVFGIALRDGLAAEGVDVVAVAARTGPSGVALIQIDARGQNTIIVVPGANATVADADLAALDLALADASILLLQLEIPIASVLAAARLAHARGVVVILDPAPAQVLPAELYPLIDIITPNETEAAALVGFAVDDAAAAARAADVLHARGAVRVVLKRAQYGLFWSDGGERGHVPAFAVDVVDTVAAGDACNGALAAALAGGVPFAEALRWGAAGGALAVTRRGAQAAMPRRAAVVAMVGGGDM